MDSRGPPGSSEHGNEEHEPTQAETNRIMQAALAVLLQDRHEAHVNPPQQGRSLFERFDSSRPSKYVLMMRFMDTYKGRRQGYTSTFKDVRATLTISSFYKFQLNPKLC